VSTAYQQRQLHQDFDMLAWFLLRSFITLLLQRNRVSIPLYVNICVFLCVCALCVSEYARA
jgi:hypothetical protein